MTNTNTTMTMNTAGVYSEHGAFLTVTDLTEILKVVPSRVMRKLVCRIWPNEVSRQ